MTVVQNDQLYITNCNMAFQYKIFIQAEFWSWLDAEVLNCRKSMMAKGDNNS